MLQDTGIILTSQNVEKGALIKDTEGGKWKIVKKIGAGFWEITNLHRRHHHKALFSNELTHYHILQAA